MKILYEHNYEEQNDNTLNTEQITLLDFEDGDLFAIIKQKVKYTSEPTKCFGPLIDFHYIKDVSEFVIWLKECSVFFYEATDETLNNIVQAIKSQLPPPTSA